MTFQVRRELNYLKSTLAQLHEGNYTGRNCDDYHASRYLRDHMARRIYEIELAERMEVIAKKESKA